VTKALVAVALLFGALLVGAGLVLNDEPGHAARGSAESRALARAAADLGPSAEPAFRVGRPRLLDRRHAGARFAPIITRVTARSGPSAGSQAVATLTPTTEEGTSNVVLVLEDVAALGEQWARVRLPVLPNGRLGWVPRGALGGYRFVNTRLVVDRTRFTATLFRGGRRIFQAPVGVGVPAAPTPTGEFYVRAKLTGFADPFYGPVAFGTNARSPVLTDWPAGGFIGIHGTNAPALIPGRVSHGCIRLRNDDILALSRLMPVGTPLTIRP
jgi:L,D-transpeptidase catalytic domain